MNEAVEDELEQRMPDQTGQSGVAGLLDDRGRAVRCFDFDAIREAASGRPELESLLESESSTASRGIHALWIGLIDLAAFGVVWFAVHMLLLALVSYTGLSMRPWALTLTGMVASGLLAGPVLLPVSHRLRRARARSRAATISRAAVNQSLCGACGYSLASLSVDPDGCVICPECGAAWHAAH